MSTHRLNGFKLIEDRRSGSFGNLILRCILHQLFHRGLVINVQLDVQFRKSRGLHTQFLFLRERFAQLQPDCWVTYGDRQPYGAGWRYDRENKPLPWYNEIIDVFGYPKPVNNGGWYLK